jgi:hypothetical protein
MNSLRVDIQLRNQQVAGSSPAGGSIFSLAYLSYSVSDLFKTCSNRLTGFADQLGLQRYCGSSDACWNRFLIVSQGD